MDKQEIDLKEEIEIIKIMFKDKHGYETILTDEQLLKIAKEIYLS